MFKSTVWKTYLSAEVYILFDYGIDDIGANSEILKTNTGSTAYKIKDPETDRRWNARFRQLEGGNPEQVELEPS